MTRLASVILPLPLPEAFDYAEPEGMGLEVGDQVIVPLGPQRLLGVVAEVRDAGGHNRPLKPVLERREAPPLPPTTLAFLAWAARYAVDAPGQPLAISLRGARAQKARPERVIAATGAPVERMTPARARVLAAAADAPMRARRLGGGRGRLVGRDPRPGRARRAGDAADRAAAGLRSARSLAARPAAERQPGRGGQGARRPDRGRRLPGRPARRRHRLRQDRGLSRRRRARARARSDRPGAGAPARDRAHPGGDRSLRGPLRRPPGRVAFRLPAAGAAPGLGGGGAEPLPHRRRRPLGAVPALRQPQADRRRRGARLLVQAGGRLHLPRARPRRGARQDRGCARRPVVGDALARDAVERRERPLPLAQARRPPRLGAPAQGRADRHARDAAGPGRLALAAPRCRHGRDDGARRADPALPQPPRLRARSSSAASAASG